MRVLITTALILLVTLAGCADSGDKHVDDDHGTDGTDGTDGTGGDGGHGGNSTGSTGDGTGNNTAPVAMLGSDALNGTAPMMVNFTLNGTDADGDDLTWTLTIDGNETANGTTLPATAPFTFDVGDHIVVLTVFDGNLTGTANLTIMVVEGTPGEEVDPNAPVDMGWYIYDPVTELCDVKAYTDVEGLGLVYNSPLGGGDWYIVESNDVAGLQIANNHPAAPVGTVPLVGGFAQDIPECKNGDQVAV